MAPLAEYLSTYIGLNLALLADIHHLRSSDVSPKLTSLLKEHFPQIYADRDMRNYLFTEYKNNYDWLSREETLLGISYSEDVRGGQAIKVKKELELIDAQEMQDEVFERIREYVAKHLGFTDSDFENVWKKLLDDENSENLPFFKEIMPHLPVEKKRELKRRIDRLTA